jgi:hypothetical protein
MSKRIFSLIVVAILLLLNSVMVVAQGPVTCGTERATRDTALSFRQQAETLSVTPHASEILLFINFNGAVVRQGSENADTFTSSIISGIRSCPAPSLTQAQKDEIVRLVRDDFSPFNIRVTTDAAEFAAYPRINKEMSIVTTLPGVIGHQSGEGGVAPATTLGRRVIGGISFTFSSAMGNDPSDVAAVISHESGHLLSLDHQHQYNDTCGVFREYHPGFGTGPLSFDPIMGEAFTDGINNWFAQSCIDPFFGVPQDDYEFISDQVDVRADDFPDLPTRNQVSAENFDGVLEHGGDVDYVLINFRSPGPLTITSDNIDLKVSVVVPGGHVFEEFNDPASTNVSIPSIEGLRYLRIEAAGNENMSAQFMTGTYHVLF